jgi:hypothetical protein
MRLDVPLIGTLTLAGVEDDPYGGRYTGEWYRENGSWRCCEIRNYLSFDGEAVGYDGSEVHGYLSDNGLYIDIDLPAVTVPAVPEGSYLIQLDVLEPEFGPLQQVVAIHRSRDAATPQSTQTFELPCIELSPAVAPESDNELVACLAAWAQGEVEGLQCPSVNAEARTSETWVIECLLSHVPPVDDFDCPFTSESDAPENPVAACLLDYLQSGGSCPNLVGQGSLVQCLEEAVAGLDITCVTDGTPGTGDGCTLYWQSQESAFLVVGLVAGVALLPLVVTCEEDGLVLTETDSTGSGAACTTVFTGSCAPMPPSPVVMHAESSFANRFDETFADRITSAFAGYDQMWHDLCIPLEMWAAPIITNNGGLPYDVLSNGDCDGSNSVVSQYVQYLGSAGSGAYPGAESFQLWTSRDLDGYSCYGVGREDSVQRGATNINAAGVVEGTDGNCCDKYDPDEKRQRGLVSGHELGHQYGQDGSHPSGQCKSKPNIMNDEWSVYVREKGFCFVSSTKQEINYRYWDGREPPA